MKTGQPPSGGGQMGDYLLGSCIVVIFRPPRTINNAFELAAAPIIQQSFERICRGRRRGRRWWGDGLPTHEPAQPSRLRLEGWLPWLRRLMPWWLRRLMPERLGLLGNDAATRDYPAD